MKIRNRPVQCLVDSGSVISVVSHSFVLKLKLRMQETASTTPLLAATGQPLKVLGSVDVTLQLNGLFIPHTFIVIDRLYPTLILGADFMRKNSVSINYSDNTVRFYDDLIILPLQGLHSINSCATVFHTVCMPKCSEAIIAVKLPRGYSNREVILESLPNNIVAIANTLSSVKGSRALIRVLNYNLHPIVLRRGMKIASILHPHRVLSITPFQVVTDQPEVNDSPSAETLEQFLTEYKIDVNPQLPPADRHAFASLLFNNRDLFARSLQDIKTYPDFELELPLKDPNIKSYTRQYPLPHDDILEADRQVNELLQKGLISESTDCSFNSPMFVVKKRDGTGRMIVDLRRVNTLLKPFIVLLPKIETLLSEITALKVKWLSCIDIFKGFWNVKLSQKTNSVTSFINPLTGISYKWNCLPMGLSVSPAAFIYVMSRVFKDKSRFFFLFTYVDDLLIVSPTISEHLQHLRIVFNTLRANNLVINPTKTSIAHSKMDFLGYTISEDGICIAPSKIRAIERIEPPKSRKSLQRLLGLLNFFRKHIPNFSQRTVNMRRLLKQDVKFDWSSECDEELCSLKQALIANPIFQPLQPTKPVYIYVDAATSGYGSAIIQFNDNGVPNVCAYLSYATTDTQKRWPIYQLELSALALTLKAYESFLLHLDINVFTDNAVVLQLAKYKPINNREKRLVAYLSQFKLNIHYISGQSNKVADCLSRIVDDLNTDQIQQLTPPPADLQNEFILSLTQEPVADDTSVLINDSADGLNDSTLESVDATDQVSDNVWIVYKLDCLSPSDCTAAITDTGDLFTVSALNSAVDSDDPVPVRRSARLAERAQRVDQPTSDTAGNTAPATTLTDLDIPMDDGRVTDSTAIDESRMGTSELLSSWHRDTAMQDNLCSAKLIYDSISQPKIVPKDYFDDEEFAALYTYLRDGQLTGDNDKDRKLLLISENYYIENDLLYKTSLPRGRKEMRLRPTYYQLCVPQVYRDSLIKQYHELLGHFSIQRLHPTMIVHFYWQNLILDIKNFVRSCIICQTSKISTRPQISPLHPFPTPTRPFQCWSFDHKKLARKTDEGNTHVLVFICHFSSYVIFTAVPDESAYTTARVFIKEVIARHGLCNLILTDKASGFMSQFFATITQILGIRHRTSAAQCSRSNGLAEQAVKRLNEGLKRYANDDVDDRRIEIILPLIEFGLRATAPINRKISPFEICHGFSMPIATPFEYNLPQFFSTDAETYVAWLRNSLRLLHSAVRQNRLESKEEMKRTYDKRHQVTSPPYCIGDSVLLQDLRVKPGDTRILTKKPYSGPYIVKDIIQHDDSVGPAYKLVNARTGAEIKRLVGVDRLKKFYSNETASNKDTKDDVTKSIKNNVSTAVVQRSRYLRARCILKERRQDDIIEYLVLFCNGMKKWTSNIGEGLRTDYMRRVRRLR